MNHEQTDSLYRVEHRIWQELGAREYTLADLRNMAERIVWSPFWDRLTGDFNPYAARGVELDGKCAIGEAATVNRTMHFGPGNRTDFVLCHELAHVAVDDMGCTEQDHHGPRFAFAYVELVGYAISIHAGRALRRAFRRAGIEIA